jgi:asparagine synthase (glutamine-hydrolysing)
MYTSNALKSEFYTPLSYMMAIDYQTYMLDDILQKVDRATMTASLEGREPLLDHRIIEYAAQLPDEFKYQNGVKKHILREIVYDYIPKEMMERPKMGFAIPVAKWLSNDLRDLVEEYCSEQRLKEHDLFDLRETKQLLERFFNGKKEYDYKIWYLLMFQMWYDKWMKTK